MKKKQKMTLWGYYESLLKSLYSKKNFIQRIMAQCDVSFTTARNWIKGHRVGPGSMSLRVIKDFQSLNPVIKVTVIKVIKDFRLNNLHSLLAFSSVYHNLLEDDSRGVRRQGNRMDAVGGGWELYFYHLVDDAGGYRRIVNAVDVL